MCRFRAFTRSSFTRSAIEGVPVPALPPALHGKRSGCPPDQRNKPSDSNGNSTARASLGHERDTRGTREGHGGPVCPEPLDRGGAGGARQGRAGEPWDPRGTDTALRGRGRGAQPALTSCLCGQRAVRDLSADLGV